MKATRPTASKGETVGLIDWVGRLNNGTSTTDVAYGFAASPEREGQRVTQDYQTYLGRTAQPNEVTYWTSLFANGVLNNEDVIAGFVGSNEYFQKHNSNVRDWLFSTYKDVLNRTPDASGFQYWLNILGAKPE